MAATGEDYHPGELEAELELVRAQYKGVRLHADLRYVTPNAEHEGRGDAIHSHQTPRRTRLRARTASYTVDARLLERIDEHTSVLAGISNRKWLINSNTCPYSDQKGITFMVKLRWSTLGFLAGGAGLLALMSMANSVMAFGDSANIGPAEPTVGLVMGGSGEPIPGIEYVDTANTLYIANSLSSSLLPYSDTTYPGVLIHGLFTPENLYPLYLPPGPDASLVKQMPLDTSVAQGVTILNDNIDANLAAGDPTTVFGYSQSTLIAGLEMQQLDPSGTPSDLPLQFVLIGDPSAPNGGLLSRFVGPDLPHLSIASLGITFYSATPADDFHTVVYSLEYDGFADFPRYPINFLSDLNAFLGIEDIHGNYLNYPSIPGPTPEQINDAIPLATSGPTETSYYMIPVQNLPLLDPLRSIPLIGNPLADLLQPDLKLIVNLGYDNPNPLEGWDAGPANVPTEFQLFPSLGQVLGAIQLLPSQTEVGIQDFIGDFTGSGPNPVSLTSLLDPASEDVLAGLTALQAIASNPAQTVTDIANAVSGEFSAIYATLLPTADIANALLTTVPAYDLGLFIDNLGDPLNAIGLPIAADTALVTLAAGFEFGVLSSLIP